MVMVEILTVFAEVLTGIGFVSIVGAIIALRF